MRVIPRLDVSIKRGRQDGVQAHDVRMRVRDEAQPAGVRGIVLGKVRREPARQRCAEVDSFHVEGLPCGARADLEHLPERPSGNLRFDRARGGLQGQSAVYAGREQGIERVSVGGSDSQGAPPGGERWGMPSQPLARQSESIPGVAV